MKRLASIPWLSARVAGRYWHSRNALCHWIVLGVLAFFSTVQSQGDLPAVANRPVDFKKDIEPIFSTHCVRCHGPDKQSSGLRLDDRESALKGGENYVPAIRPKNSSESPLIRLVAGLVPEMKMPQKGEALTLEQIGLLRAWIDQGAQWPEEAKVAKALHWSLNPVVRPEVPRVANSHRKEVQPIDAFILAQLQKKRLNLGTPASRGAFVRRIYLVMHGLPPTPEQVRLFVTDKSSDAVAKLVDRVLDSPRYGERWARHWLDVVRFAESNGFETNHERSNAYHYRDYVIQSLNEDKPYNKFVQEQIAGDYWGVDSGTGFLVAGAVDIVKSPDINLTLMQRQDELADIVNTTGTAFLGLTLGCARCHDHKFDPISQKDFFGIQAVFAGVNFSDRPLRRQLSVTEQEERTILGKTRDDQKASLAALKQQGLAAQLSSLSRKSFRPPVNAQSNEEVFSSIEAKAVRFTILATTGAEPCIDELEIYDSKGTNVALAKDGTTSSASGTLAGYAIHQLKHINDGLTGNSQSWISSTSGNGWVQLDFLTPRPIQKIVWSRDRSNQFKDRVATDYRITAQLTSGEWKEIVTSQDREPFGKEDPNGFLSHLPEQEAKLARELQSQLKKSEERFSELSKGTPAWLGSFSQPKPTHRLYRGDPMQEREVVAPDAVAVLGTLGLAVDEPEQQRRIKLAEWIVNPRHPLTARVMVNRIWHYIFGTGIVDTPSDFGANGGVPTNTALLDWLADEFVRSGWSIKHIQKLILSSETFGQSSSPRKEGLANDAEARLLWRFPPRRLEAEAIRDCILATSGALDFRMGGPGFSLQIKENDNVDRYFPKEHFTTNEFRRMIYLTRIRQQQDSVFGAFDCPSGNQVIPKRTRSNTPLQALNLLNSNFVLEQSAVLSARLLQTAGSQPKSQVSEAFKLVYGREPDGFESSNSIAMIRDHGLDAFCRALFNTSEFLFVF